MKLEVFRSCLLSPFCPRLPFSCTPGSYTVRCIAACSLIYSKLRFWWRDKGYKINCTTSCLKFKRNRHQREQKLLQNKKEIATDKSDRVKGTFAMLSWNTYECMKSRQTTFITKSKRWMCLSWIHYVSCTACIMTSNF